MKSARFWVLALVPAFTLALLAHPALAQNKKKSVPAVFGTARYVWVESMDGDIYNPNLLPADRQAISDVENAIQNWGRYVLTATRSEAELIFVVRTGRIAEVKAGVSAGDRYPAGSGSASNPNPRGNPNPGQQQPVAPGATLGGEVGPPDDLLEVCQPDGSDTSQGTLVWMRSADGGLASPGVPLFKQLKTAIDHDYPR